MLNFSCKYMCNFIINDLNYWLLTHAGRFGLDLFVSVYLGGGISYFLFMWFDFYLNVWTSIGMLMRVLYDCVMADFSRKDLVLDVEKNEYKWIISWK